MKQKGKFIVIEGLEGAGKSTIIRTIESFLQAKNQAVLLTREPGGTRVGEVVRSLIKDSVEGETLDPRAELLLLYAARAQHIEQVIRPALEQGIWVICDRFELSTIAYQGGGRGISLDLIKQISTICLQGFTVDLTFFLDILPEQGLLRASTRGAADRIEKESLDFFNKVYQAYHQAIAGNKDHIIMIDASQSLQTVQKSLLQSLDQLYAIDEQR